MKRIVDSTRLVGVQHPRWTVVIDTAATDTNFWAGIQWLDGQQEAPVNTVLPQQSPTFFTRKPVVCFLEVDKTSVYVFGMLPRFLEIFLESGNLVCSATAATKTASGIIQRWFNFFAASFYKTLGIHFSREAKEIDAHVVGVFTPVSLFVYGDDHFANLSVYFQNDVPLDTHGSTKPSGVVSSSNSLSNFS